MNSSAAVTLLEQTPKKKSQEKNYKATLLLLTQMESLAKKVKQELKSQSC